MIRIMPQIMRFANLALVLIAQLTVATASHAAEKLHVVPNNKVCMVTNMEFPRPQIPVKHAGKTYYGCCENCKKTIAEDAEARVAIDPVSGKPVDKATAVIAAREDGSVIYFESKKTFQKFSQDEGKAQ